VLVTKVCYNVLQRKSAMRLIREPLHWDDANEDHLWTAHRVTPDEVEELLFERDGFVPKTLVVRDGDYYVIFGETLGGRYLKLVGSLLQNGRFRVFGARDMEPAEKRRYRKGLGN